MNRAEIHGNRWRIERSSPKTVKCERSARSLSNLWIRIYGKSELLFTITWWHFSCCTDWNFFTMPNEKSRQFPRIGAEGLSSMHPTIHSNTAFFLARSNLSRLSTDFHQFGRRNVSSVVWVHWIARRFRKRKKQAITCNKNVDFRLRRHIFVR